MGCRDFIGMLSVQKAATFLLFFFFLNFYFSNVSMFFTCLDFNQHLSPFVQERMAVRAGTEKKSGSSQADLSAVPLILHSSILTII